MLSTKLKKKVLVIEDDEMGRYFAHRTLTKAGFEVETAEDGKEGYERALTFRPDLVVLDLLMPVMHGYDCCQELRKNPDFDHTKIVVTTGRTFHADRGIVEELGANGFLVKPFKARQLLIIVAHLLDLPKPS